MERERESVAVISLPLREGKEGRGSFCLLLYFLLYFLYFISFLSCPRKWAEKLSPLDPFAFPSPLWSSDVTIAPDDRNARRGKAICHGGERGKRERERVISLLLSVCLSVLGLAFRNIIEEEEEEEIGAFSQQFSLSLSHTHTLLQ